jgi:16S rRNA G966 N2-methylase RsmD
LDRQTIRGKFGGDYVASERTFRMGIDQRFTSHIAERFSGRIVLETCTGGGFTTISLARTAEHVFTIEIDPGTQAQARLNLERAGLLEKVTFLNGDALDQRLLNQVGPCDSAFLDPDWAVTGPEHVFRFQNSNTRPPADKLLERAFSLTSDVGMVLPPSVDTREFSGLPQHELQEMYLCDSHELRLLFFGTLAACHGVTQFRVES